MYRFLCILFVLGALGGWRLAFGLARPMFSESLPVLHRSPSGIGGIAQRLHPALGQHLLAGSSQGRRLLERCARGGVEVFQGPSHTPVEQTNWNEHGGGYVDGMDHEIHDKQVARCTSVPGRVVK